MATTLYLPTTIGGTPISPAVSAGWNSTAGNFTRHNCFTTKQGTTLAATTYTLTGGAGVNFNIACRQYISPALQAQTITGTTSAAVYGTTNLNLKDFFDIVIRVMAPDGVTSRGTVASFPTDVAAWTTTGQTSSCSAITNTSVTAQAGDFLVIEIGDDQTSNPGNPTLNLTFGDSGASDYAYTPTDTTTGKNPTVQFSQTILFINQPNSLMLMGVGI